MALAGVGQSLQVLASLEPGARSGPVPRGERAVLRKVSQEFEAIFIGEMLKEMRNSTVGHGLLGQDRATQMYQEMSDQALAQHMAESGGLGIGRMIEAELGRNLAS